MNIKIERTPDYLDDEHLSRGSKEYLKVLNASDTPVECMPVTDARNVLVSAQASINVDLSGIEETERFITYDNFTVRLVIVRPEGKADKLPVFVFIHGGGWVLGDYPTHKRLVRDLVVESGYACVFVDYTPSPEARYPQAVNEVYAAVKWLSENGDEINVDSSRLAVVGNSAGGNMALVTSLKAKELNGPKIKLQILMWPVTDTGTSYDSYKLYGKQRFLTKSLMEWMFDQYTTDSDERKDIHISPLNATTDQLKGLPPTIIQVAENDILRDQGEEMGRKLDAAGVEVITMRYDGVVHDWGMLNGFARLPETRALVTFSAAMLRKYLQ